MSDSMTPEQQQPPSKVAIGKQLGKEFSEDDVTGLAAEVAYHLIFAIPPIIVLLVLIAALLENFTSIEVVNQLTELVDERAPADTQDILNNLITDAVDQISGGFAIVGIVTTLGIALWSGSNGLAVMMKAFNRAYDADEDRPYVKKRLTAIGLTVLMGVLVNLAIVLLVFGQRIGSWIAEQAGLGSAFELTVAIARWPLGLLFLIGMLAVLYYLAPNVEQSFRWISPGSILAVLLWVAAIFGFSTYLRFGSPGSAYGVMGSLLVFLFFLYISAIILLVGAELNAIVDRQYGSASQADLASKASLFPGEVSTSSPPTPSPPTPSTSAASYPAYAAQTSLQGSEESTWRTLMLGLVVAAATILLGRLGKRS